MPLLSLLTCRVDGVSEIATAILLADSATSPASGPTLLESVSPLDRAKMVMALLGLVLLGVTLVTLTWWAGHCLRRSVRKPLPPTAPREHDWAHRPLMPPASAQDRQSESP